MHYTWPRLPLRTLEGDLQYVVKYIFFSFYKMKFESHLLLWTKIFPFFFFFTNFHFTLKKYLNLWSWNLFAHNVLFLNLKVLAKPLNLQDQDQQNLVMQVLKLVLNCLSFDFIGSSADESADDLCTVQIPTTWRTSKKRDV